MWKKVPHQVISQTSLVYGVPNSYMKMAINFNIMNHSERTTLTKLPIKLLQRSIGFKEPFSQNSLLTGRNDSVK